MSLQEHTPCSAPEPDLLDRCIDLDAHEMAPTHFWKALFGDGADDAVALCSSMHRLVDGGTNSLVRPDISADDEPIDEETVWTHRGASAPAAFDFSRRIATMDVMGVDRQLVFPGYGFVAMVLKYNPSAFEYLGVEVGTYDPDALGNLIIHGHNEWCVSVAGEVGDRVRPVAVVPTDSVAQMVSDTEALLRRGVRTFMIPNGVPPAGMSPADARLDPFWRLLAESGSALTFHIGTEFSLFRSQAWDRNVPAFESAHRSLELGIQPFWGASLGFASETFLSAMILGGVLERHPALRVGSIEVGASWVGPLAERMDLWAAQFPDRMASILSMKPSEYMKRQVRVTPFYFEDVASYFERYPALEDVYCFSTDYPHREGGKWSKKRFSEKLAHAGERIRRKFFRENGLLLTPD